MRLPHLMLALLINASWGFNFVAVKWAVADFPPIFANSLRFGVVLVLLIYFLRPVAGQMRRVLSLAILMGVMHFGFVFTAMANATDLAPIALVAQTSVPMSTALAILFLGERIGWRRTMGLALSFGGVLVIGFDPAVFHQPLAVLLTLAAAFIYGISAVMMRRIRGVGAMTIQAWIALAAVPGSLLVSLVFEVGQLAALQNASVLAWGAVFYTAIGASIIGHGGMYFLFQRYEVSTVSPYMLTTPLFAVTFSMIIFGETLSWHELLGGLIVMSGVTIITLRNRRRQPLAQATPSTAIDPPASSVTR